MIFVSPYLEIFPLGNQPHQNHHDQTLLALNPYHWRILGHGDLYKATPAGHKKPNIICVY
jgi:hypothetical protein